MPTQEPVVGIIVGQTKTFSVFAIDAQEDIASLPSTTMIWSSTDFRVTIQPPGFGVLTATVSAAADIDTTVTPSVFLNVECQVQGGITINGQVSVPLLPALNTNPASLVITENS